MASKRIETSQEGDEQQRKRRKPTGSQPSQEPAGDPSPLTSLQRRVGNRLVQRMVMPQRGGLPAEVDDEVAARIQRERGEGQPLGDAVQRQMGLALGADLNGVRVHTSPEADALNRQLDARAFTTGQDVFFRQGEYQPRSSGGQELIAHELAHVVQQSRGAVGGSAGKMTVNPPEDRFEQEADGASHAIQPGDAPQVQRQELRDDEEERSG